MANKDDEVKGVNNEGVHIRIKDFGDGSGVKIDLYDKDPKDPDHKSVHVKVDLEEKSFEVVDNVNGEKESGSGGCYLTTACLVHLKNNFEDNCEELTILRWFRDNFISPTEISNYYEVAPEIVNAIDKRNNATAIYEYIYEIVIRPCVDAIKVGNYDFAFKRYKSSILSLQAELIDNYCKVK